MVAPKFRGPTPIAIALKLEQKPPAGKVGGERGPSGAETDDIG